MEKEAVGANSVQIPLVFRSMDERRARRQQYLAHNRESSLVKTLKHAATTCPAPHR